MKWAYSIEQKMKAALLLAIVFVLLFVKNVIDKQNFNKLGDTFSTVYEDRLLAESYIYKLSDHLSRKKILIDSFNDDITKIDGQIKSHNAAIVALIHDFGKTKLTKVEAILFEKFKKNIEKGLALEKNYLLDHKNGLISTHKTLDESFYATLNTLNLLSNIQLSEGELLNKTSKNIVSGSTTQTQFELSLLIVIGLLIQVLIFASRSTLPKSPQNPSLN